MIMDAKQQILELIERDSTLTTAEIAAMLCIPEEQVRTTIAQMEEDRTIVAYRAVVNWSKTDRPTVTALIELKVSPQRGHGFEKIAVARQQHRVAVPQGKAGTVRCHRKAIDRKQEGSHVHRTKPRAFGNALHFLGQGGPKGLAQAHGRLSQCIFFFTQPPQARQFCLRLAKSFSKGNTRFVRGAPPICMMHDFVLSQVIPAVNSP